eukprot:TRINITY_DN30444_c0_g1_i1.p1 TRINITY_DN30444_c0_g1~~TRINITY_DN30444_c0_g1_i1.p1  ORF type:complete len:118 (+),score=1.20 TRINITY_DN30444_c0_g1_i1:417-770(+)
MGCVELFSYHFFPSRAAASPVSVNGCPHLCIRAIRPDNGSASAIRDVFSTHTLVLLCNGRMTTRLCYRTYPLVASSKLQGSFLVLFFFFLFLFISCFSSSASPNQQTTACILFPPRP